MSLPVELPRPLLADTVTPMAAGLDRLKPTPMLPELELLVLVELEVFCAAVRFRLSAAVSKLASDAT